jgi:MoaA/NifB/PqqE/SkfB family radical SAM enzyme
MKANILKREHTYVLKDKKPKFTVYDFIKVGFFLFGFPKNAFGSIDVTYRCNLRCRHCYFVMQNYEDELEVEEWIKKLESLRLKGKRNFPFLQCTWVGGEPLLRKDLIERAKGYFLYNTVVTNGMIPLPNWKDVFFYVSVDGTEEAHERIRGKKGIYKKIKKIANRKDLHVTIACCITKENYHCIEDMVLEWSKTDVKHMVFDFYTPIKGIKDDLWVEWDLRDRILDQLMALKQIYGNFFITPLRTFRMMKSDLASMVVNNCLFKEKSFSFDPLGRLKSPCMIGSGADCSKCGCVVPYYMHSLTNRWFVIKDVVRELFSKLESWRI